MLFFVCHITLYCALCNNIWYLRLLCNLTYNMLFSIKFDVMYSTDYIMYSTDTDRYCLQYFVIICYILKCYILFAVYQSTLCTCICCYISSYITWHIRLIHIITYNMFFINKFTAHPLQAQWQCLPYDVALMPFHGRYNITFFV